MFVGDKSEAKLPLFVKCLEDVEVLDGQEVMLFCVVTGQPMPTISWYHNDNNIVKNEEYVFTYDRQTGHIYLVILDCLADDEGEFQCVATNVAGQAVTRCKLRILPANSGDKSASPVGQPRLIDVSFDKQKTVDKTSIVSPATSRSQELRPTSIMVPDRAAVNGHLASTDSLTLMPPDILFHTKKIPGQSRKVASYRTILRRASDNDLIGYRSQATDPLYRQNASWKVSDWTVYSRQTVQPADNLTAALDIMSPTQSNMPSESRYFVSSSSLQPVTSVPSLQIDGTEFISSVSKSSLYSQLSRATYVKTPTEMSSSLASSRLFEPPRFTVPLSSQTVRDGDAAMLRVRFHGNPTPKLQWFFNQKTIVDEEDFVIRTDLAKGESVLWIKEVFPEDDGEFICKAENDYGTAISHCRLTVQCKCHHLCICTFMNFVVNVYKDRIFCCYNPLCLSVG